MMNAPNAPQPGDQQISAGFLGYLAEGVQSLNAASCEGGQAHADPKGFTVIPAKVPRRIRVRVTRESNNSGYSGSDASGYIGGNSGGGDCRESYSGVEVVPAICGGWDVKPNGYRLGTQFLKPLFEANGHEVPDGKVVTAEPFLSYLAEPPQSSGSSGQGSGAGGANLVLWQDWRFWYESDAGTYTLDCESLTITGPT